MTWLHHLADLGFYVCAAWILVLIVALVVAGLSHLFRGPLDRFAYWLWRNC